MPMKEMEEETEPAEITLGTGKLLGLFIGLVVICAIFFSLGFALGKNSGPIQTQMTDAPTAGASSGVKPDAGAATSTSSPEAAAPSTSDTQAAESAYVNPVSKPTAATAELTPAAAHSTPPQSFSDIVVQVAAVSRRDDAEILMNALRNKGYPVFLASITGAADGLFRVQVGPFVNLKEAEITKSRLSSDGYSPIVKR